ncbi:MAG: ABC transporter substrate-binding protein [Saprospiraceae bacterium]
MKNKLFIAVTIAAILLWVGCNQTCNKKVEENKPSPVELKLGWIFSGSYAPEALASKEFAKQNKIEIKLEPGGLGKDPLKLVGDNEFGVAASDEVLHAVDKGGDFVIIGLINYNSPACYISLEKYNIKTPKDLEGKTVGILPFGGTGLIYKILLKKNGIDETKIKEVTVYPDLKVFIAGKTHQVQPAFIYDETVTLDEQGIKYNVLEPKDFNVSFKGAVYFTTGNTVKNNPNLVQEFVNTMAAGVNGAINNPEKAIQALKEIAPDIDPSRELKVWRKGIEYYQGYNNQPLTSDLESWNDMITEMKSLGEIKGEIDLNTVLNFSFINRFYNM